RRARFVSRSFGHDRGSLDLDQCIAFDKATDDYDGHCGKVSPDYLAIRVTDLNARVDIRLAIGDEPCHADEMLRSRVGARKYGDDVSKCLCCLPCEVKALDHAGRRIPADLARYRDYPSTGADSVCISPRREPAVRLNHIHITHGVASLNRKR